MPDARALTLGARLRSIRQQQALSLQAVEMRSGGKWKAVVVGSYERGDRQITVSKLVELADFYGVPVAQLLPEAERVRRPEQPQRVIVDLEMMSRLPAEVVGPLSRFVANVQAQRGDYNGRVLTLRSADLSTLSLIYDRSESELLAYLLSWGVVSTGD